MTWKEVHIACPCGKSSDAYCIDTKGLGHCFSCDKTFREEGYEVSSEDNENYVFLGHRSISPKTFQKYNVMTRTVNDIPQTVGFIYPNVDGKLDESLPKVKLRALDKKEFKAKNFSGSKGLFGQNIFDPGSKESLTIVEGEFDALAAYEMLHGKSAVVSVQSASTAYRDCETNYDYINSFNKIILCFDNDEPGQKASKEVSSLFDFNKVYKVDMKTFKDANDYLEKGEVDAFRSIWNNAKKYVPDSIINSFPEIEQSLVQSNEDLIATYPFTNLQNALYGLHRGEIVVVKGDSGIGKTEIFRAMEHHILKTTKSNIGIIHLEEDNSDTVKGIATYELGVPVFIPEHGVSNEDILEAYKKAVGGSDSRVYIHESFDVDDADVVLNNIRYLVKVCKCDFIFLDHISWLGAGQESQHLKLEAISQKLKLLAKELRFCMIMISHINDDGKVSGSRNIFKVANTVIHLDRDRNNGSPEIRNRMNLFVEKGRRQGSKTGPAGYVIMDPNTGCLRDVQSNDGVPNL